MRVFLKEMVINRVARIVKTIVTRFNISKDLKRRSRIIPKLMIKLLIKNCKNILNKKMRNKNRGVKNNKIWKKVPDVKV